MLTVRVNGVEEATEHNKDKAKEKANEIARDLFPSPECASIEVVTHDGGIVRSMFYDGWNVYTDRSQER